MLNSSGSVQDSTDIGCSDHFFVRLELGKLAKCSKMKKHTIKRWHLDRFGDNEVKLRYQNGLSDEGQEFTVRFKSKLEREVKGYELVNEVLAEWESIIDR